MINHLFGSLFTNWRDCFLGSITPHLLLRNFFLFVVNLCNRGDLGGRLLVHASYGLARMHDMCAVSFFFSFQKNLWWTGSGALLAHDTLLHTASWLHTPIIPFLGLDRYTPPHTLFTIRTITVCDRAGYLTLHVIAQLVFNVGPLFSLHAL